MKDMRVMQAIIVTLLVTAVLTLSVPVVGAQSGGSYSLTWNTLDGGSGVSMGGAYALTGTIGQPEAGGVSGGSYAVVGGFWPNLPSGLQQNVNRVFMPFIIK